MSALLTAILVVLLFAIMMGTVACDEVRTLRRRVIADEDRLADLEAKVAGGWVPEGRLSAVPSQRNAG